MKTLQRGIIGVVALLLASAVQTFAIEGLKLSIHCPDVWLSWPSVEGENYIVQWREDLSTNSTWVTLTNLLPAEIGTSLTIFVHSNRVDCPTGQIFGMMISGGGGGNSLSDSESKQEAFKPTWPTVIPKDGSRTPVPLGIYPPGLDLSGYIIIWPDGSTDEWSAKLVEAYKATQKEEQDGPQPEDAGGGSSGCGFYQVVRDGVHVVSVTNLTNGVLSGALDILIEAGNADPAGADVKGILECANLIVDGAKFAGDGLLGPPPAYPWKFSMDTAFLENGDHYLQVEVTWANPDSTDGNNQFLSRYSDAITLSVSNEIYYPQWESLVGEADIAAFYVKTVYADAPWRIDIADQNGVYLQSLSGYATNGAIEGYWNLVDTNGVAHTNANLDPAFNSTTTMQLGGAASVTKTNPPKKQLEKDWPELGVWTVAIQDFFKWEYSANNLMTNAMLAMLNLANIHGGYFAAFPPPSPGTNLVGQTFPMRYQKTNHMDTNITDAALAKDGLALILFLANTNSRNFFYNGHASAVSMAAIPSSLFATQIHHRYRFVFLDGCSTTKGSWPGVFGIKEPGIYGIDYYRMNGIRPGAFLGYTVAPYYSEGGPVMHGGILYDHTIPPQVPNFITNLIFFWDLESRPLYNAIQNAKDGLPRVMVSIGKII